MFQDGDIKVLVNITVKDVAGIKDSRGIQEKDIFLWDELQFDSTVRDESNKATVEVIYNSGVFVWSSILLKKCIVNYWKALNNKLKYFMIIEYFKSKLS